MNGAWSNTMVSVRAGAELAPQLGQQLLDGVGDGDGVAVLRLGDGQGQRQFPVGPRDRGLLVVGDGHLGHLADGGWNLPPQPPVAGRALPGRARCPGPGPGPRPPSYTGGAGWPSPGNCPGPCPARVAERSGRLLRRRCFSRGEWQVLDGFQAVQRAADLHREALAVLLHGPGGDQPAAAGEAVHQGGNADAGVSAMASSSGRMAMCRPGPPETSAPRTPAMFCNRGTVSRFSSELSSLRSTEVGGDRHEDDGKSSMLPARDCGETSSGSCCCGRWRWRGPRWLRARSRLVP